MSKRKTTQKKSSSSSSGRGRSFWTNAGSSIVPAINFARPFDFQEGIIPINGKRLPLASGSLQYFATKLRFSDDWPTSTAFITAVSKLFQAIRENLRSNLAYSLVDLQAYLANVMYLQAAFSVVTRDFRMLKFRDPQHPTFERVWGNKVPVFDSILRDGIGIEEVETKDYLKTEELATSLTYMETVLIPKASLLILPPAMSEYMRWLFDDVFTDNINPALGQYYWNEFEHLPLYTVATTEEEGKVLEITEYIDSNTITLEQLANICEKLAAQYGVIIADLKRAGASMVSPNIALPGNTPITMKYDEMYFTALENAYTGGYLKAFDYAEGTRKYENPDFFLVDILEGCSSDQANTMLSLMGGLVQESSLVKPISVVAQYALMYLENADSSLLDANYWVEGSGTADPDELGTGTYAIGWTSDFANVTRVTVEGIPERTNDLVANERFTFNGYEYSSSLQIDYDTEETQPTTWVTSPAANTAFQFPLFGTSVGNVRICMRIPADQFELTGEPTNPFTQVRTKENATGYLVCTSSYATHGVFLGGVSRNDDVFTEEINIPVNIRLSYNPLTQRIYNDLWIRKVGSMLTPTPVRRTLTINYSPFPTFDDMYFSSIAGFGTTAVELGGNRRLAAFIQNECDHHVPFWYVEALLTDDSGNSRISSPACIKETRVTASYNAVELESLLYSLTYSLAFVHANATTYKKA